MGKSIFKKAVGYFLRVCVFQIGEYKRGPGARKIIHFLKRHYDLSDKKISLEPAVLENSIKHLEAMGGVRGFIVPEDGGAHIDYMLVTFDNLKKRIEEKGGRWIEIAIEPKNHSAYKAASSSEPAPHYLQAILFEQPSPEWKDFAHNVLMTLGWKMATVDFPEGTREVLIADYAKEKPPVRGRGCFLRCHSPGRSYGMDHKYIGRHLSIKKDLCLFNYRGTHKSTGIPSEGGYYLDADAVFQELVTTHGYKVDEIWSTGFCLGGAVAAYLKAKYHDKGINWIGENTFTSIVSVIEHQIWPASILGKYALTEIQSDDPAIVSRVHQDLFNTLKKLEGLKPASKKGVSIIINTDADAILPKNSGLELFLAAKKSGTAYEITHHSLCIKNPHADNIFDEERVWKEYCGILS